MKEYNKFITSIEDFCDTTIAKVLHNVLNPDARSAECKLCG